MARVRLLDFRGDSNKGLWLNGPRERTPETHMRRLTAVNAITERELRTRNGTQLDVAIAAAYSVVRFDDIRFQAAAVNLYKAGVIVGPNVDGTPLEFAISEPRAGTDAEFLFVAGGGTELFKAATDAFLTANPSWQATVAWGIVPPSAGVWGDGPGGNNEREDGVVVNAPQEKAVVDAGSANGWEADGTITVSTGAPTDDGGFISFPSDDTTSES